jgi:hypothetical protein
MSVHAKQENLIANTSYTHICIMILQNIKYIVIMKLVDGYYTL